MSYELYVHLSRPLPEVQVIGPWKTRAVVDPMGGWLVQIDESSSFSIRHHYDELGMVDAVTFGRPCRSLVLWDGVVRLLERGCGIAYAPRTELEAWVTAKGTIDRLPADMRAVFERERVIASGAALREAVSR